MPYKVMIVDDEPIIRFGLSSCVNWEQMGLSIMPEAANGEVALSMIRNQAVDILITDIRMPLMDGLELTRRVKEFLPNVKVILISSYSDFEFAREAVKLGVVVDYLLKPTMEPDDLIRILDICKQRLDAEGVRNQKVEKLELEEYKSQIMQFEVNLKSYLNGATEHISWKPNWLTGPMVIAIWKYDTPEVGKNQPIMVLLEAVKEQLNLWDNQGISFVSGNDEIVTLLADYHGNAIDRIRSNQQQIAEDEGLSFTVGISPIIQSFSRVRDALNWATLAIEASFFKGRGKCYQGWIPNKSKEMLANNQEELQQEKKKLREEFSKSFVYSDREVGMGILELYIQQWKSGANNRQEIILEARNLIMMSASYHFKHQTEDAMQSLMNKLVAIENSPTLDSLVTYVRKELQRLWEPDRLLVATDDVGGAHTIQLALSYIQDHYRQEISLQEVANYAHMSKNYFSEQFKKRTGFNFIDFVIRLRIHYAKHLLETTSLRVVDIGEQSGFNSPKHFLKLFKRMTQATPGEYREQLLKEHDKHDNDNILEGHK